MNTMLKVSALLMVAFLCAVGCGGRKEAVTLAGSTAFQPFAEKLADQYMSQHPGATVSVQGGGSTVGIQSALQGTVQIGMADLVQLPADAKTLTATVVARDGVAIIVHPSNAITNLTTDQVRDIFNGKITNWKMVGGADHSITVVSREAGSGTRSSFEQIVGGVHLSASALVQDSNGTIRETVANDPNAMGYLSHGLLNKNIRDVPVDGFACTTANVSGGRYKLVRPVFFLTRSDVSSAARDFMAFVLSDVGQEQIRKDGLLSAK